MLVLAAHQAWRVARAATRGGDLQKGHFQRDKESKRLPDVFEHVEKGFIFMGKI